MIQNPHAGNCRTVGGTLEKETQERCKGCEGKRQRTLSTEDWVVGEREGGRPILEIRRDSVLCLEGALVHFGQAVVCVIFPASVSVPLNTMLDTLGGRCRSPMVPC